MIPEGGKNKAQQELTTDKRKNDKISSERAAAIKEGRLQHMQRVAKKATRERALKEKIVVEEKALVNVVDAKANVDKIVAEKLVFERQVQERAADEVVAKKQAALEYSSAENAAAEENSAKQTAAEQCAAEKTLLEQLATITAALTKCREQRSVAEHIAASKATLKRNALANAQMHEAVAKDLCSQKVEAEKLVAQKMNSEMAARKELAMQETVAQNARDEVLSAKRAVDDVRTESADQVARLADQSSVPSNAEATMTKSDESEAPMLKRRRTQLTANSLCEEADEPGLYTIILEAVVGDSKSTKSADIDKLAEGTVVHVLEVSFLQEENRVRGRIQSPSGWISLLNTKTGRRWASKAVLPLMEAVPKARPRRAVPKPAESTPAGLQVAPESKWQPTKKELRWTCGTCEEVNKATRSNCNNCGRDRPEDWKLEETLRQCKPEDEYNACKHDRGKNIRERALGKFASQMSHWSKVNQRLRCWQLCGPPPMLALCDEPPIHSGESRLLKCIARLQSASPAERNLPPCASYCFDWLAWGKCTRRKCSYLHSLHEQSSSSGAFKFAIDDKFKRSANSILAELSSGLPDRNCFVLDGKNAATVTALQRDLHQVLAPSVDQQTVSALEGKCLPVLSSASSALQASACCRATYGCIYLDYMWPLNYFRRCAKYLSAVKCSSAAGDRAQAIRRVLDANLHQFDGFEDVERILGARSPAVSVLSTEGSVLAVTVVHDRQSRLESQKKHLDYILLSHCRRNSLELKLHRVVRAKNRPVSTFFYGIG